MFWQDAESTDVSDSNDEVSEGKDSKIDDENEDTVCACILIVMYVI